MVMRSSWIRLAKIPALVLVILLAGTALHQGRSQRPTLVQSGEPTHVAILGVDNAFAQLPATLAAGPTLFSFENRGTKRHEKSIALLQLGVVPESLLARQGRLRQLACSFGLHHRALGRPAWRT